MQLTHILMRGAFGAASVLALSVAQAQGQVQQQGAGQGQASGAQVQTYGPASGQTERSGAAAQSSQAGQQQAGQQQAGQQQAGQQQAGQQQAGQQQAGQSDAQREYGYPPRNPFKGETQAQGRQQQVEIERAKEWGQRMGGEQNPVSPSGQAVATDLPPSLAQATPRTLSGMPVIGADDQTIGRVDSVVRNKMSNALQLVVSTEQGQRFAIELDEIQAADGQLRLSDRLSQSAIDQQAAAFNPEDFTEVNQDAQLARLTEQRPAG
jgi:hypothetical protein